MSRDDSFVAEVMVDGKSVQMEVDSGASLSVMSEGEFRQKFGESVLERTNIVLSTYSGEKMKPVGCFDVDVEYKGRSQRLPLVIMPGKTSALLGRNWIRAIGIQWESIMKMSEGDGKEGPLQNLLSGFRRIWGQWLILW